jgi:hypothetical protein
MHIEKITTERLLLCERRPRIANRMVDVRAVSRCLYRLSRPALAPHGGKI